MLKFWNPFKRLRKQKEGGEEDLAEIFRVKYHNFKELLDSNTELSGIIADISLKLQGNDLFGMSYVRSQTALAVFHTLRMIKSLNILSGNCYAALYQVLEDLHRNIRQQLHDKNEPPVHALVLPQSQINREMVDWVGGKNANLGEVLNQVRLPIPEGFAITTQAFKLFLQSNDLVDQINKQKLQMDPQEPASIQETSEEIQRLILTANVPEQLEQAILNSYDALAGQLQTSPGSHPDLRMAMRSSAVGEDSEFSFAGQYVSLLNVLRERLVSTYKVIVASLYTPRAITYRFNKGIRDEDVAMSVACLRMVDSTASGVMYSRHPFNPMNDYVMINAVWGLGPYAVEGVITPDNYLVAKEAAKTIIEMQIKEKPVQLVTDPRGGLREIAVPVEQQNAPCLNSEQIQTLAGYAEKLEQHYGGAQDIEWTLDQDGRLLILQTRPLHLKQANLEALQEIAPPLEGIPLLLEGGQAAFPGVAYGKAYHVQSEDDLITFPQGGILIARHSSPQYTVVMQKAAAIITDSGSVTGHMASLAREFEIPSILDAKTATSAIPPNAEITVDAYSCRVYGGKAEKLLQTAVQREPYMKGTPVHDTLKRIAKWITPLHLINPKASNFKAESCRSLHDIMRFVHERSYGEMFKISDVVSNGRGAALKLKAPIPLDLYVIDLGGGLSNVEPGSKKVIVEQVNSVPFQALLKGMLHKDLIVYEPRPIELKGFFSVMTEQMLSQPGNGTVRRSELCHHLRQLSQFQLPGRLSLQCLGYLLRRHPQQKLHHIFLHGWSGR